MGVLEGRTEMLAGVGGQLAVVSLKVVLGPRPVVKSPSRRSPMRCACLVTERASVS